MSPGHPEAQADVAMGNFCGGKESKEQAINTSNPAPLSLAEATTEEPKSEAKSGRPSSTLANASGSKSPPTTAMPVPSPPPSPGPADGQRPTGSKKEPLPAPSGSKRSGKAPVMDFTPDGPSPLKSRPSASRAGIPDAGKSKAEAEASRKSGSVAKPPSDKSKPPEDSKKSTSKKPSEPQAEKPPGELLSDPLLEPVKDQPPPAEVPVETQAGPPQKGPPPGQASRRPTAASVHRIVPGAAPDPRKQLVVVLFYEDDCPNCDALYHIYEKIIARYPQVLFLEASIQRNMEAIVTLRLREMPTFIAFRDNAEVGRITTVDELAIEDFVKTHMKGN